MRRPGRIPETEEKATPITKLQEKSQLSPQQERKKFIADYVANSQSTTHPVINLTR